VSLATAGDTEQDPMGSGYRPSYNDVKKNLAKYTESTETGSKDGRDDDSRNFLRPSRPFTSESLFLY
jgi:hypothetical protein